MKMLTHLTQTATEIDVDCFHNMESYPKQTRILYNIVSYLYLLYVVGLTLETVSCDFQKCIDLISTFEIVFSTLPVQSPFLKL